MHSTENFLVYFFLLIVSNGLLDALDNKNKVKLSDALQNNTHLHNNTNMSVDREISQEDDVLKKESRQFLKNCGITVESDEEKHGYFGTHIQHPKRNRKNKNGRFNENDEYSNESTNMKNKNGRRRNKYDIDENHYGRYKNSENSNRHNDDESKNKRYGENKNSFKRNSRENSEENDSNETDEDYDSSDKKYNREYGNKDRRNNNDNRNEYGENRDHDRNNYNRYPSYNYGSSSNRNNRNPYGTYGTYNSNGYDNNGYNKQNSYDSSNCNNNENGRGNQYDGYNYGNNRGSTTFESRSFGDGYGNGRGYSYLHDSNQKNGILAAVRTKRSTSNNNEEQCISQCVLGYLEVLDSNRFPSETLVIKWLQDHSQNDMKRIKSLRDVRRCFGKLSVIDAKDGCEFSKALSNCLNLDLE